MTIKVEMLLLILPDYFDLGYILTVYRLFLYIVIQFKLKVYLIISKNSYLRGVSIM